MGRNIDKGIEVERQLRRQVDSNYPEWSTKRNKLCRGCSSPDEIKKSVLLDDFLLLIQLTALQLKQDLKDLRWEFKKERF